MKDFVLRKIEYLISKESGKSKRTLSELVGRSPAYLSTMIRERRMPSIEILHGICNYFEISMSDFFKPDFSTDKSIDSVMNLLVQKLDSEDFNNLFDIANTLDKQTLKTYLSVLPKYNDLKNQEK